MSAGIVYPLFGGSLRYRQLVVFWEKTMPSATSLWERYLMALDEVTERLERITSALDKARVPHALVGGRPSRSGWRPKIRPLCARRKTWISFFAPRICPHRCTSFGLRGCHAFADRPKQHRPCRITAKACGSLTGGHAFGVSPQGCRCSAGAPKAWHPTHFTHATHTDREMCATMRDLPRAQCRRRFRCT